MIDCCLQVSLKQLLSAKQNTVLDHNLLLPRLSSQTESRYVHDGGVVRSNLHGLETRKNARKSGHERTNSLVNARKSDHERTNSLVNARKSDHERTNSLVNARKSDHERTNSLMNARKSDHERTKVW